MSLPTAATVRAAAGTVLYLVLVALLTLGVTTAIRDTAVSIGTVIALLYLPSCYPGRHRPASRRHLEQIAPMPPGWSSRPPPVCISRSIGAWFGLGVLACWAAGALVVGGLVLRFRDA